MNDKSTRRPETGPDSGDDLIAALIRNSGPREAPPVAHYAEVLEATRRAWQAEVTGRRRRRIGWGLAAGLAIAVIAVGLGLRFDRGMPGPVVVATTDAIDGEVSIWRQSRPEWTPLAEAGIAITSGSRLRSGAAGLAGLILEDGTSLRLAAASAIAFETRGRMRLDAGAVYVDTGVDKTTGRRIEVVTPAGVVRDVGTQFEVRYRDDSLTIRIREGRVILARGDETLRATAGEQIRLDEAGRLERSAVSPFGEEWRWVQAVAPLPYTDTLTVRELLEWVARETGREVHFAAAGLATRASRTVLHGNPHRLLPMEALAVMLATTDLTYTVVGDGGILVTSAPR